MKKLLAILVAALMLFGVFGGTLAHPAKRNVAPVAQPTRAIKTEAVKASDPMIGVKTSRVKAGETLDEALNVAGGTIAFTSEGDYPWAVMEDENRVWAQSSNAGVHSTSSVLTATVNVGSNKAVKFDFKAWGEGTSTFWDKCIFAIDGNAQFTYGALNNDWTEFTCNIAAGEHVLTWTFSKDSSMNGTGDYFAIDNVQIAEREALPINAELDAALNVDGGSINFHTGGTYPWVVVEDGDRVYAANGNSGINSSESVITATVITNAGDLISFDFKAWGEGTSTFWDHCDFYVDGIRVMYYGAYNNVNWETFTYELTAGEHELKWSFTKDNTQNGAGDYFYIDNVAISAPVAVTSISAPATIDVPMYRSEAIEYTVLPENATNKAVTFTSADESIAIVDASGKVKGVAVGTTTVTIASVNYPDVTATVTVNVYDAGISAVTIYGSIVFDPDEVISNQWVTFTDMDPTSLTVIGDAPVTFGAAYAYGNIYGYTKDDGYFFCIPFNDIANSVNYVGTTSITSYSIRSMSIDYTSAMMYGIASDGSNFYLAVIDMDTGAVEIVGGLSVTMLAFAIDIDGNAYGIASDGNLYKVDLDTAGLTLIGSTGQTVGYVQDMCFDYNTGILYWAHCNADDGDLFIVDTADASCDKIDNIGPGAGCEVVGMFIVPANEPEPPTNIPVTGITVTPADAEIRVGETAQFTAAVSPVNASNKAVEWDVDDDTVIAIDQNGTVIGLAEGVATVYATTDDGAFTAYATVNVLPSLGDLITGYYFETEPEGDGWLFVDSDGDGYNWTWDNANFDAYEGSGLIYSNSYVNYVGALSPDNWAISPLVILPSDAADVTLYALGQDPNYPSENFALYVGTTTDVSEMTKVGGDFTATGEYVQYTANLTAYCGQAVYFAIRHYNVTDMFMINIDQVEFWGTGTFAGAHTLTINYQYADGTEAAPAHSTLMPEGFEYSIASPEIEGFIPDLAVVEGVMGTEDITVTVTYVPDGSISFGWFFEEDPFEEGWLFIDDDGDGYNWIWQQDYSNPPYCTAYEGEGLIYSESYHNNDDGGGVALTPDNWAISPAVEVPTGDAEVYLYAQGQDSQGYDAEVFAIYVGTSQNIEDMVKVSEDLVTTYGYQKFSVDLSDYLGQTVYIAIRHYNVTDMFMLDIDNVVVKGHNADGPTPVLGDLDGDGEVTFLDVSIMSLFLSGEGTIDEEYLPNADFNQDGGYTYSDLSDMYLFLIG